MKNCMYWIVGGIIALIVVAVFALYSRGELYASPQVLAKASCCRGSYKTPSYRQMAMLPGSFNSNYEGAGCCGTFDGCFCTSGEMSKYVEAQPRAEPFIGEGILIDTRCYSIDKRNWTNDHLVPPSDEKKMKGCAGKCVADSIPAGLLLEDGTVYILIMPSKALKDVMAKRARICGFMMLDSRAIFVTKVEVFSTANGDKKGGWREVKFTTMM